MFFNVKIEFELNLYGIEISKYVSIKRCFQQFELNLYGIEIAHLSLYRHRTIRLNWTFMELKFYCNHPLYLEVTDYQLFVVNTVEKWIGFYL